MLTAGAATRGVVMSAIGPAAERACQRECSAALGPGKPQLTLVVQSLLDVDAWTNASAVIVVLHGVPLVHVVDDLLLGEPFLALLFKLLLSLHVRFGVSRALRCILEQATLLNCFKASRRHLRVHMERLLHYLLLLVQELRLHLERREKERRQLSLLRLWSARQTPTLLPFPALGRILPQACSRTVFHWRSAAKKGDLFGVAVDTC